MKKQTHRKEKKRQQADDAQPTTSDWFHPRFIDMTTRILSHQPTEPCRSLANRYYNERLMLLADQTKGAYSGTMAESSCSSPHHDVRRWLRRDLAPYGVEALSAFQLPEPHLHLSDETDRMYGSIVALLHRQGRASRAETEEVLGHTIMTPLCVEAAEDVKPSIVVAFLCNLAEQEIRGIAQAPLLESMLFLMCAIPALNYLVLAHDVEEAASSPRSENGEGTACCDCDAGASVARVVELVSCLAPSEVMRVCAYLQSSVETILHRRGSSLSPLLADETSAAAQLMGMVQDAVATYGDTNAYVSSVSVKYCLRLVTSRLSAILHVGVPMAGLLASHVVNNDVEIEKFLEEHRAVLHKELAHGAGTVRGSMGILMLELACITRALYVGDFSKQTILPRLGEEEEETEATLVGGSTNLPQKMWLVPIVFALLMVERHSPRITTLSPI